MNRPLLVGDVAPDHEPVEQPVRRLDLRLGDVELNSPMRRSCCAEAARGYSPIHSMVFIWPMQAGAGISVASMMLP